MDIEKLFRKSLDIIKEKWGLPSKGFLAGGSISNIAWNIVTGKNAPVNDIDIYLLNTLHEDTNPSLIGKQSFKDLESKSYEDYKGVHECYETKRYYYIDDVSNDGIFNIIQYNSNTESPMIIIDSFDINCCQLGYDISEDKFYYTKEFVDFLESSELKVTSILTPSHTALRLFKKKDELGANLNDSEINLLTFLINNTKTNDIPIVNTIKYRFKSKYSNLYIKYEDEMRSNFRLHRDIDFEKEIKDKYQVDTEIYTLLARKNLVNTSLLKIPGLITDKDILFWYRNLYGTKNEKLYMALYKMYDQSLGLSYVDCDPGNEKIKLLNRITSFSPRISNHLKGFKLSEQVDTIDRLISAYGPEVAILVLEKNRITSDTDLSDEMTNLLLELSVRREVHENMNRINEILYESDNVGDIISFTNDKLSLFS